MIKHARKLYLSDLKQKSSGYQILIFKPLMMLENNNAYRLCLIVYV